MKLVSMRSTGGMKKFLNMVAFPKIAAFVAFLTTGVTAWDYDIKFTRFRDTECKQPYHTDNLRSNHCYNTGGASIETAAHSFIYDHRRTWSSDNRPGCTVAVYPKLDCQGEPSSLGDATATFKQCGVYDDGETGYNSISVTCDGKLPNTKHKNLKAW
ncbi:hypothetical protein B0A55_10830 [Friedmanniomyces simplex]|uniref:Uncharacterized protein n=1 Tax=Friedmanniomyces simplex TaxID=329884 RepID=A0A4V5NH01_9PEZI|nr:hypothetical protein B0A55_10830 [Friedmanniomyces simplex]